MRRISLLSLVVLSSCAEGSTPLELPRGDQAGDEWNLDGGPIDPSSSPPSDPKRSPDFGPTVQAATPPPPLSGGTLAVSRDGLLAIAADPDRDVVHLVKLTELGGTTIALNAGDEPGRVVEDNNRRVHVALRRGGAIVSVDLATHTLVSRRNVCPAPRGIAFDEKIDSLYVACAGGELVTLPAGGGAPTRVVRLERDLRDVVLSGGRLYVSTFRTAQLLEVSSDGKVAGRRSLGESSSFKDRFASRVAWRTIVDPFGGVVMLHQRSRLTPVSTEKGGYAGSMCDTGIVQGTLTAFAEGPTAPTPTAAIFGGVLPVDAAFSPDGSQIAVVNAGNAHTPLVQEVVVLSRDTLSSSPNTCTLNMRPFLGKRGEVTAVAWTPDGKLVTQVREPAVLYVGDARIPLSGESRADTGFAIFHANSGAGIACASCHPEGGDDGHVWDFVGVGPRRTQTFRGGLSGSEPFHWDGDMANMSTLVNAVFVGRMSGVPLSDDRLAALTRWIDAVPTLPQSVPLDASAVARGDALFHNADVGCAGCHSGKALTNNATVDVGTGRFQVPSLRGIAWRAPFLHNGCAPTLLDRFSPGCGGNKHGNTATLNATQLNDLVTYLETL